MAPLLATVQAEKQENDVTTIVTDESWREFVQQGATLKREAKSRLEVGLLNEAAKLAEQSRDKFTLAAEKGYRNAVKESQAASKLLSQIQNAGVAQKVARDEAQRLTEEAAKLLDGGDATGAMTKASLAVKALQMVEQNYGRVSTAEVTKVIELRVRAEEKDKQIRLELQAKTKEESKKSAKPVTALTKKDTVTVVKPAAPTQDAQLKKEPKSPEKKFEVKTVQQQAASKKDTADRPAQKKQEKAATVDERKAPQQAEAAKQKEDKTVKEEKATIEAQLKQEKEARDSEQTAAKQDVEKSLMEAKLKRQREAAEAARAAAEAEAKERAAVEEERSKMQSEQDEAAQALAKKEEAAASLARQRDGDVCIFMCVCVCAYAYVCV